MLAKLITDKFFDFGSNENGYYLRLGNGFQLCWVESISIEVGKDTVKWYFPKTFINNSVTIIPFHRWADEPYGWTSVGNCTSTWADLVSIDQSNGTSKKRNISAIALGKWK